MHIKNYRRYLTVQLHAKPATVNRRLAAIQMTNLASRTPCWIDLPCSLGAELYDFSPTENEPIFVPSPARRRAFYLVLAQPLLRRAEHTYAGLSHDHHPRRRPWP